MPGLRLVVVTLALLLLVRDVFGAAPRYADHQVIVRLSGEVNSQEMSDLHRAVAIKQMVSLVPSMNLFLVKLENRTDVSSALKQLSNLRSVVYAQADHYVKLRDRLPNDPEFAKQWSLKNPDGTGDIRAGLAWDIGLGGKDRDGNDLVIAIVDGGVDINHRDLAANIWVNTKEIPNNQIDDDQNGFVDDVNGWNAYENNAHIPASYHGTHVAGITGASGNNGLQVTGINWNVKIMPIAASSGTTSVVLAGYGYALAQKKLWLTSKGEKGANVVVTNSSFGVDLADCKSEDYKAWDDMYSELGKYGILSAAATANLNVNVDEKGDVPTGCASPFMISVTNTDRKDQKYKSAGFGLKTIALGAPGTAIFSTLPNDKTGNLTGTSMATPHVAGSVAFLYSVASSEFQRLVRENPANAALKLKAIMMQTVDPNDSLKGKTISGGRLNLGAAAKAINNYK